MVICQFTSRRSLTGLAVVLAALATACEARPSRWTTTALTVDATGTTTVGGGVFRYDISPDGTKIAFDTVAANLGPSDSNGTRDVYVRDLVTGANDLVSVNAAGTNGGNRASRAPVFSPDGTSLAFLSDASDLGPADGNGSSTDVYVRDLLVGSTELVSVDAAGVSSGNAASVNPDFARNGSVVVFESRASDLGPVDANNTADIYARDLTAGITSLVSAKHNEASAGNGLSEDADVSPDGSKITFESSASDLDPGDTNTRTDLYVRDLVGGTTALVSTNATGSIAANGASQDPVFSPDSSKIAFESWATDLGMPDTNGATDVYVKDIESGALLLASVRADGRATGHGTSGGLAADVAFSHDGSKIAFESEANDLAAPDTNTQRDIFVRDMSAGTTILVSPNAAGSNGGDGLSFEPVFSPNGERVGFYSSSSNLTPVRDDGGFDVFVRDLRHDTTTLISINRDQDRAESLSVDPRFRPDGTLVFRSAATGLVVSDTPGDDLFLATPPKVADLAIGLTSGVVVTGSTFTYTATVANNGPDQSTGTTLLLLLPAQVVLASVDLPPGCVRAPDVPRLVVCEVGTLNANQTVAVDVGATTDEGSGATLVAAAAVGSSVLDMDGGNNQDSLEALVGSAS